MRTGLIFASLITVCSLSLTACDQHDQTDGAEPIKPQALSLPPKQATVAPAMDTAESSAINEAQQRFDAFWQTFRSAVIAADAAAIADLAAYPFKLKGEMDFMPVLSLSRGELIARMNEILAYEENVAELPDSRIISAAQIVAEAERVTLRNEAHFRIANLEFTVVAGQWRFVRAYINETE